MNSKLFTPEFRLVVACSWLSQRDTEQTALVTDLLSESLNWDMVTALIVKHGLAGVFCHVMNRVDWVNVPDETKIFLKKIRVGLTARALGQYSELLKLGRVFAENGVDVIPLKGVALSCDLYGGPAFRSSGDVDILVRQSDRAKAVEILKSLGYLHDFNFHGMSSKQQQHILNSLQHHEFSNVLNGVHVELHWRVYLWPEEHMNSLWERSLVTSQSNGNFRHLSRNDSILFLADHGARHGWTSLKWVSDMAMLLEGFSAEEWDGLYARAEFFNLQRVLLQTSLLLEWLYCIMPSPKCKALLCEDKKLDKLTVDCITQLISSGSIQMQHPKLFEGIRQSIRLKRLKPIVPISSLLRDVLITPGDFAKVQLPDSIFWGYLILRPYFWVKRHFTDKKVR